MAVWCDVGNDVLIGYYLFGNNNRNNGNAVIVNLEPYIERINKWFVLELRRKRKPVQSDFSLMASSQFNFAQIVFNPGTVLNFTYSQVNIQPINGHRG